MNLSWRGRVWWNQFWRFELSFGIFSLSALTRVTDGKYSVLFAALSVASAEGLGAVLLSNYD